MTPLDFGALDEAGEHLTAHAAATPDKAALVMHPSGIQRTFAEIEAVSVRLAQALQARGVQEADRVAVLLENQPEFFDVVWAAQRIGCYVTPINWHLAAAEAGYIVGDCNATVLVASSRLEEVVAQMGDRLNEVENRICVDGELPGFETISDLLAKTPPAAPLAQREGGWMFYSSGTTGQPKGILPPLLDVKLGAVSFITRLLKGLFGFDAETVYLSPAPLYHAAPAGWTIGTQRLGGTAVVLEHFDPLEVLAAVERHRITHMQLVPTHMIRLLRLSPAERGRFDLSSLRSVIHAAAPCPVEVKHAFIEWLGPIVHEFYSGSEGAGFCYIGPEEWLAHPGSVGRSMTGAIHILDDSGEEVPIGSEGQVWFETNRAFEYHGDPEKTKAAWDPRGWSWLGDMGRVDAEGYLFLGDRSANMIISGGVNIYPREVEDLLVMHPAVDDVAVIGTPDPDMGERVTAYVQLNPGAAASENELIEWCRARLSHFKCPRSVRFVDELPRLPTGKLLKRLLTDA